MIGARDPLDLGRYPLGIEPVHDVLVEARMASLQAHLRDVPRLAADGSGPSHAGPTPRRSLRRVRVLVGHALVALGSMVAGPHEHADHTTVRAV